MATLQFKGKTAVWNHHLSVPYHTLEKDAKKSLKGAHDAENLIIEGDNLLALKALLPQYQGRVKCIYIDPPYNTGNEGWTYNDNMSSPMMKDWLGQVVGKAGEDLTRHDKWLCMMTPRLRLLWELLADDGVLYISIDDNEIANLRLLMSDLVGEEHFITTIHVEMSTVQGQKVRSAKQGNIVKNAEYVLVYGKGGRKTIGKKILFDVAEYDNHYSLFLKKESAHFVQIPLTEQLCANDDIFSKMQLLGLAKARNSIREMPNSNIAEAYKTLEEVRAFVHDNAASIVRMHDTADVDTTKLTRKIAQGEAIEYVSENRSYLITVDRQGAYKQLIPLSEKVNKADDFYRTFGITTIRGDWWAGFYLDMGNISKEGGVKYENGKKPVRLIKQLISFVSDEDDIVLDSFAGSGTTAQAVIELNKEDKKNRHYILVQMPEESETQPAKNVCADITLARVTNVLDDGKQTKGLTYYTLGPAIDADTLLNGKLPRYNEFAKYVYYIATGKNHPDDKKIKEKDGFVGSDGSESIWLLYKADIEALKTLAITLDWAQEANKKEKGRKVVYAPACYLDDETLDQYNIKFVSIPYNLFEKQQ